MAIRHMLIASASAIGLLAGTAHAQSTDPNQPPTNAPPSGDVPGAAERHRQPDQIVITGIRGSAAASIRDQARLVGHCRRAHRRGRRQVPRQERRRSAAARPGRRHQPRVRRRRARHVRGTAPNLTQHAAQRPQRRDRRLVRPRPARRHPQLQLPDAAVRDHRPAQGLQEPAGGPRGRRHRRHDRRPDAQSARPRAADRLGSAQRRYTRARRQMRPAGVGPVQLEERRRDLRRALRRRLPEARDPPRRRRGARLLQQPGRRRRRARCRR